VASMTDKQRDAALMDLRRELEKEHPGKILDFYHPPLREVWDKDPEPEPEDETVVTPPPIVAEPSPESWPNGSPINLILFGPPGTGKTYWIRQKMSAYVDSTNSRRYEVVTFHPSFSYEDFVQGIRPVPVDDGSRTEFRMVDGVSKRICDRAKADPKRRYAIFIDEINRANIAKVFGELITLIESDKRARYDASGNVIEGMTLSLAGGAGHGTSIFGVPANLDIYGTMNTADRSIALLDIALRRRFEFEELEPNYEKLATDIDGVQLGNLLRRINDRLEFLLDRDHRIGHAYLMQIGSIEELRAAFRLRIIPLLQEYFFDDLERVSMVLATADRTAPFITSFSLKHTLLFNRPSGDGETDRPRYLVTAPTTWTASGFRGIYDESVAAE
jgi:5-methylcytosine-specific restriction enzyme B